MGVTFLHTGDLHLGSPLRAVADADADLRDRLARATHESFERIVTAALHRDVDFVVVAGDCYDGEARSVQATEFLVDQFERLADADVPCYVVHGNHDPLGAGAEAMDLPPNVRVFGSDAVETACFPDDDRPEARILGRSYGARHESNKLYYHYAPPDDGVPTVGVLHTGLNPDGRRYAPCGPSDLASKDVDYWALGHVHEPRALRAAPGAFCGIPQGRHVGETGPGGCMLVDLEAGSEPDVRFLPTSPIVWRRVTVDVGRAAASGDRSLRNLTDLEGLLADEALALAEDDAAATADRDVPLADHDWEPAGVVCRWELTGRAEVARALDDEATRTLAERLRSRLDGTDPFVWTEAIRDRTGRPIPDRERLVEADDVVAELCALTAELRTDPEVRADLRGAAGEVWERVEDPDREDVSADRLALTDDRLDDLVDRALETAVEELAVRRNHVD